jgi:hypothetical protein
MMNYLYKEILYSHVIVVVQDKSQQPPAQELLAKDLHGSEWRFRHIYRGKSYLTIDLETSRPAIIHMYFYLSMQCSGTCMIMWAYLCVKKEA